MKLKMNKYKPGAGSDSRLEQDYHKVTHLSTNCGCVLHYLQLQVPTVCCLRGFAAPYGAFRKQSGMNTRTFQQHAVHIS